MSFNPYNPEPYCHPGPGAYNPQKTTNRRAVIKTRFELPSAKTHTEPAAYTLQSTMLNQKKTIAGKYQPLAPYITPAPSRDFCNIFSERGKICDRCGVDYLQRERSQVPAFYTLKSSFGAQKRSIHGKCKTGVLLI